MTKRRKVVVVGLDGLDPTITESMLASGRLPHLAALRSRGGYTRLRTTTPAQTPVAWSTFATGVNPGGHGIFDFLRRDPDTYLPDLALNRYEAPSLLLPPRVVNLRRGQPLWDVLGSMGVPATVIRCPCTYPPDHVKGRLLAGMGVPDIRGGLGTATFYTTRRGVAVGESEQVIELHGDGDVYQTQIVGPRNPRTRTDITVPLTIRVDRGRSRVVLESDGRPASLEVVPGTWSDWLRVKFRSGLLQATAGMLRFFVTSLEPALEVYASPVNFDPSAPMFAVSHPWEYAAELAKAVGLFHTTGMGEDHAGLINERLDEGAFLSHCELVLAERERMLMFELDRLREGLLFCLFDTPDRVQHMFWRFREPDHPANRGRPAPTPELTCVVEEQYARCDAIVGRVLAEVDDSTLVIVLSDHGFGSFRRGLHLNAWLAANGYLRLRDGIEAGDEAGEFLQHVDWGRTRAYALGLGSIYLNVRGREAEGTVAPEEADDLAAEIARGLTGLRDEARGTTAVRQARCRAELYDGPCAAESPDVVVECADGYRASWTTALGGVPATLFEDNTRKWAGDHIVDPALVPGVLFASRPIAAADPSLVDLAPTILAALGVPAPTQYEGRDALVAE